MRLLLGNNASREVHKPLDVDEAGQPLFAAAATGELHDDWLGRGPHLVNDLPDAGNTEVVLPDDVPLSRALADVKHLWDYHSAEPPAWVVVVDDGGDAAGAELVRAAVAREYGVTEPGPEVVVNLVTNAGLDFIAKQLSGSASATAVAKWVALTANATAPSASDTTLTGEITTAGGGLVRAAATYAHTTGASTYTLTITFTANGSDSLPVTANKAGFFDAASSGNLVFEDAISPAITWNASGDAGTLTETVTV